MTFKEIAVGELMDFIESDLYKNSKNIPITRQRAISQSKNPRADPNDIALIIAYNQENNIVGFIGALPDRITKEPSLKIAWNSCWWVDPELGGKTAMPLFFMFIKRWKYVMFRELTPHTNKIISKMNYFEKVRSLEGQRYFLRLNTAEVLPKRNTLFKALKPLLLLIDIVNNRIVSFQSHRRVLKTPLFKNIKPIYLDKLDDECIQFLTNNNQNELFRRSADEINWILDYPWIRLGDAPSEQYYYFSDKSNSFSNQIVKLFHKDKILFAVLFISENHKMLKIPYVYFDDKDTPLVSSFLIEYIVKHGLNSIVTFNQKLINSFSNSGNTFIFSKPVSNEFIVSKSLIEALDWDIKSTESGFQDGEGDFCFT